MHAHPPQKVQNETQQDSYRKTPATANKKVCWVLLHSYPTGVSYLPRPLKMNSQVRNILHIKDSQPKDRKHDPDLEKQTSNFQPPFFINDLKALPRNIFTVLPSKFGERKKVPPFIVGCSRQSFDNATDPRSKFRQRERAPLKVSST